MQKVLTADQMREVDRLTTERYGIPSLSLMENAAKSVVRVITRKLGGSVKGRAVLVLCGKGNNGGDGAAVARLLDAAEAAVTVILFCQRDQTSGDARVNWDRLPATVQLCEAQEWYQAWEFINRKVWTDLACVVDSVFGTGLKGFRDDLNEIIAGFPQALHVAVDVPSGLTANESSVEPSQFSADVTVTFTSPKLANIVPPAYRFNGELVVADIGSPAELIDEQESHLYLAAEADVRGWLKRTEFSRDSYKNRRGHALLIAGSRNYSGAAVLAGNAAIRSGCGLATLAVPKSSQDAIASRVQPEVMVRGVSETSSGAPAEAAVEEVKAFLKNIDVVAIGSGLSTSDETKKFVRRIAEERQTPIVIDADGLTALSPFEISGRDDLPLVLTPHEGEFAKLLGIEKDKLQDVLKDRVAAVRDLSTKHRVFLVLKGERVMIGHPDGRVVVVPTGNPGLGKAGNGDTLTGIIAGFMAQGAQMKTDLFETLVAAAYIAGMAGDVAAEKYGKRVMTASDVRESLGEVFNMLERADAG